MQILYPGYEWIPGCFKKVPTNTWASREYTRQFLKSLEPLLFIEKPGDWQRVSREQVPFTVFDFMIGVMLLDFFLRPYYS
jgi:hypothetical protein